MSKIPSSNGGDCSFRTHLHTYTYSHSIKTDEHLTLLLTFYIDVLCYQGWFGSKIVGYQKFVFTLQQKNG